MRLLEQVKSWVDQEAPDSEAIAQTLDNLCYQLAGATTAAGRAEIEAAIAHLLYIHPEPKPEIVRPESQITHELDPGPLVPVSDDDVELMPRLSPEEKQIAFRKLLLCHRPH